MVQADELTALRRATHWRGRTRGGVSFRRFAPNRIHRLMVSRWTALRVGLEQRLTWVDSHTTARLCLNERVDRAAATAAVPACAVGLAGRIGGLELVLAGTFGLRSEALWRASHTCGVRRVRAICAQRSDSHPLTLAKRFGCNMNRNGSLLVFWPKTTRVAEAVRFSDGR